MISPDELKLLSHQSIQQSNAVGDPCVLLAEDDPALQRYLEVLLQRAGYRVLTASDGLEAMKLLLGNHVDVVVTDALMPNLTGYELCRFIRSSQQLSHLPMVLLSALDPKNADLEQVDIFLTKPVKPEELLSCLAELVPGEN